MQPTALHLDHDAHQLAGAPRNRARSIVGIGVALLLLPIALVACGSSSASSTKTTVPVAEPPATPDASVAANAVQIKLIAYKPAKLTVAKGTTVTWNQMDPGFHTVTSGTVEQGSAGVTPKPDGMFGSNQLAKGKTFSNQFDTPGTFTYFCEIHPATMRGEVTVN